MIIRESNSVYGLSVHIRERVVVKIGWPNHQWEADLPSVNATIVFLASLSRFIDAVLPRLREIQKGDET